jgi:phage repressor protein C with HTH and peptisase S24 domain
MLTHEQVWTAIEALAVRHGLTVSGLARKSGLDPTTFNRSKRIGSDGRQRWPSTESIAKIIEATSSSLDDFIGLLRPLAVEPHGTPAGGFSEHAPYDYGPASLRSSRPAWQGRLPMLAEDSAEIVEVISDDLEPVYRRGVYLVASRDASQAAGDRLLVRSHSGVLLVRRLAGTLHGGLNLTGWGPNLPDCVLQPHEIAWSAKVVWATL